MPVTITVLDAFDIAEQIERNGAKFYRKAAEISNDPSARRLFLKLAAWEVEHEKCFANMKEQISESDVGPESPDAGDTLPDPRAMAGLAVFGLRSDPAPAFGRKRSSEQIVGEAIHMEKASIVFYEGLKDFVPFKDGRQKLDDIIKEEMRHIGTLYESLKEAE